MTKLNGRDFNKRIESENRTIIETNIIHYEHVKTELLELNLERILPQKQKDGFLIKQYTEL